MSFHEMSNHCGLFFIKRVDVPSSIKWLGL